MTKQFQKKCCEYADGFEWEELDFPGIYIDSGLYVKVMNMKSHHIDLLLDRAIQGWNRESDYKETGKIIEQGGLDVAVMESWCVAENFPHDGTTAGIREARTKALEFVFTR